MSTAVQTPSRAQADESGLRHAILHAFPSRLLDEQSPTLDSLVSLLRVYSSSMTAEDLFYKTEAVLVSEKSQSISREVVEQVRSAIQAEWEGKMRAKSGTQAKLAQTPAGKPKAALGTLFGITPQTPVTPAQQTAKSSYRENIAHGVTPTESSSASQQTIETLNPQIPSLQADGLDRVLQSGGPTNAARPTASSSSRVVLAIGTNPKAWNYRYMFERPGIKGQALDDGIEGVTQSILSTYGVADEDLADPSVSSQESVYVIGRIAPALTREEKADSNGQANLANGLVVEVSRRIGAGSRTPIHLSKNVKLRGLPTADGQHIPHSSGTGGQLGLFPGLIAGFRGRNGAGDAFIVEEILIPPSLPLPASSVGDLMDLQHSQSKLDGEPLHVLVASGPFTLDVNLEFAPWHRMMDHIERHRPDVVLLMGPFLPANHAALLDPDLSQMPQEIFETHIASRLRRLCESSSRTTAILLPSARDIISPHAAWPQPMFDKAALGIHKRVKCLPNPCMFSVNEVIFGTSTADVLRDLRAEELVIDVQAEADKAGRTARDPMARSVRQLLHQRHFYPLYPASSASELSLDVTHASLAQFSDVSPDVLLLPSVLTPFAKVVDGTVVVNPGAAAKGSTDGRGTFAALQIMPMAKRDLQQAAEKQQRLSGDDAMAEAPRWPHALYERTRVDITRL